MEGYETRDHAARRSELLRIVANSGALSTGHYLARQEAHEEAVAAVLSTVRRPSPGRDGSAARRRLGALVTAIGGRLPGGRPATPAARPAVGTPDAAG